MKFIRNILLKILGLRHYLRVVSKLYIVFTTNGIWKNKYPELFFLDTILSPGKTCIDIGANLGYYSIRMAKLIGVTGHVYAVEPIPLFGKIWEKNLNPEKNPQVHLLPYALGETTGTVEMGMPVKNGRIHHGMTKIASSAKENYVQYFTVEMRNPDVLFSDLTELHFIKCDVEGYESVVFKNMEKTISRFRPLIQSELSGRENKIEVMNFMKSMNYKCAILKHGELKEISNSEALNIRKDFYFIPN